MPLPHRQRKRVNCYMKPETHQRAKVAVSFCQEKGVRPINMTDFVEMAVDAMCFVLAEQYRNGKPFPPSVWEEEDKS